MRIPLEFNALLDRVFDEHGLIVCGWSGEWVGAEVRDALGRRAEHLIGQGLAERQSRGVSFGRNLLETLRRRELDAVSARLATETGQTATKPRARAVSSSRPKRGRLLLHPHLAAARPMRT
jgi:hypothetical protein